MGTFFALFLTIVPVGLLLHFYARHRGEDITLNWLLLCLFGSIKF